MFGQCGSSRRAADAKGQHIAGRNALALFSSPVPGHKWDWCIYTQRGPNRANVLEAEVGLHPGRIIWAAHRMCVRPWPNCLILNSIRLINALSRPDESSDNTERRRVGLNRASKLPLNSSLTGSGIVPFWISASVAAALRRSCCPSALITAG